MKINFDRIKSLFKSGKEKTILLSTAAVLVVSGTIGLIVKKSHNTKEEDSSSISDEVIVTDEDEEVDVNTITYGTYLVDENQTLENSSFALVPFCISYDDNGYVMGKSFYEEYTKLALDNNKQIGYMFNPSSTDRASMYLEIRELKKLMSKYDVNYPIIYNIDSLYTNASEQDKEYNYKILSSFIEKMNENGCYIMIAGTKDSLEDMKNRFNNHNQASTYEIIDKLVFGDVELNNDYCMKIVDNKIESKYNYTSFIDLYGYNDSNHFVEDFTYTVKPEDTLNSIASTYDFNAYNIMKYNNKYSSNTLYNGQQLAIPSQITKKSILHSIREYNYKEKENTSSMVSIDGTYIKDKQVDFDIDKISFGLIEYTNIFDDNWNRTYMTGNYAFSKFSNSNVPFGIVYSPNGVRLSDVYCSLRNLKLFMKAYPSKYPIYYNVDSIFESKNDDKFNYDLSKAFITRMEYDRCFAGLIGTQENIKKLKALYEKNNDIDKFNKVAVALRLNENEEVTYTNNVGLYVYNTGRIVSKIDYQGYISKYNLNDSTNFKDDFAYVVKSTDTLEKLATKFQFKEWNIKMYNRQYNLSNGVTAGQVLYFPNILEPSVDIYEENNTVDNNTPIQIDSNGKYYIGIDVSDNQGKIDWEALVGHIDYAIIKFGNGWFFPGFGGYNGEENALESTFKYNYSECKRLGIPVGLYVFSNYYMEGSTNYDYQDEAKREAEYVAKYLYENGYTLELPLYMDYEPRTSGSMYENVTPEIMGDIIKIQKQVIESYGYYYGLYTGEHFYNTTIKQNNLNVETWLANYPSSNTVTEDILRNSNPTCANMEGIYFNNNQISSDGSLPGINKRVDVNIADQQLIDNCNEFYKKMSH